jgi:molybdate transport system ATP-binding protein
MTLAVNIKKQLGKAAHADEEVMRDPDAALNRNAGEGFTLDIEFAAPPGVTILFGASGSGKTTTLKSIAGIIRPDAGRIEVDGCTLYDSTQAINLPIRKRRVGYVFQNLALFPHLTARENIEFGMTDVPRAERHERAAAMMRAFKIEHTATRKPRAISGGEAQRVALARALSSGPRLLLLDEPLSAIDETTKLAIIADLKAINRELRLPILYVTHSREEAITLGERLIVYDRGRIIAAGEPLEVFSAPVRSSVARLSGIENIFEGRVVAKNEAGGSMRVEIANETGVCRIEVPLGAEQEGAGVRVAVPAGDILLALEELRATSARNRLCGYVTSIEDKGHLTVVSVQSGVIWRASLTRQAVHELNLAAGREVWIAFKTHSCYLLDE